MKEDEKTLKAIDESIEKWKRIVHFSGVDLRANNCSLCRMFEDCCDCPIFQYNGTGCESAPYKIWFNYSVSTGYKFTHDKKSAILANLELSFLYEVRLFWINREKG